jgi:hypothetical protein
MGLRAPVINLTVITLFIVLYLSDGEANRASVHSPLSKINVL